MQQSPKTSAEATHSQSPLKPHETPERVDSNALLKGKSELVIDHQGREYRLRLTAQGKLILTA